MKNIRRISNVIILIGVLILVGTAGASDTGEMDLYEALSMVLLSFSVITAGKALREFSKLRFKRAENRHGKRIKLLRNTKAVEIEYKRAG